MATYLFTWNPARWQWKNLKRDITKIKRYGYCKSSWSCGVTKRIQAGDRAFLIKLGKEPRGIIASGAITSEPYEYRHWEKSKGERGEIAHYVDINWDTLLDPVVKIFPRVWLKSKAFAGMHWEPQASGVRIPDAISETLEKEWSKFLKRPEVFRNIALAEEIDAHKTYIEGTTQQITINIYERNSGARTSCITYYGLNCSVCGFNFEKVYGDFGKGFIHVHHLKSLSEVKRGHKLNPVKDLRPVCPNCHAMLHQRKPAYSIGELRSAIKKVKAKV